MPPLRNIESRASEIRLKEIEERIERLQKSLEQKRKAYSMKNNVDKIIYNFIDHLKQSRETKEKFI